MTSKSINKLQDLVAEYQRVMQGQVSLKKFTYYAITYHSTAIEGSTLTEGQVYNLLDLDIPAKNRAFTEQQMVIDHQKALVYTINKAVEKKPVTEILIKNIGGLVLKNTGGEYSTIAGNFDSSKGDYRLLNVRAGNVSFPNYTKVPDKMKALCKEINEKIASVKTFKEKCDLAFYIHLQYVSIHPFVDGNGRTARLLMNYILAYFDLPIFYVYKSNRTAYINSLEKAQNENKVEAFMAFMYRQYQKFLETEIKKV
jgi:Fic family protein